jgi:hypothetical protein
MWGASYNTIRKFKPKSSWGSYNELQKAVEAVNHLSDQKGIFFKVEKMKSIGHFDLFKEWTKLYIMAG